MPEDVLAVHMYMKKEHVLFWREGHRSPGILSATEAAQRLQKCTLKGRKRKAAR